MKLRKAVNAKARLVERQLRHDRLSHEVKRGYRRPGSLNPSRGR